MNLRDIVPASDGSGFHWGALCDAFDWVSAMRDVPQHPAFHAEADVATHVRMVCEELLASRAWRAADDDRCHRLFLTCLLHDVAKPDCTRIDDDGQISSRGHSRRGARRARDILWRAGVDPLASREQKCVV